MPTLERAAFYTTASAYEVVSPETDYTMYVVGLSIMSQTQNNSSQGGVGLVKAIPITDMYGHYNNREGCFMKGRGVYWNLPIRMDNPYFEVADDEYIFIFGGRTERPIAGVFYYYKEYTGVVSTIPQRTLLGVGT